MTVRIRDNGANALLERLNTGEVAAEVGILGQDGAKPTKGGSPVTVGDVAQWAEFGIGQPMRSWLRGWFDENEAELKTRISAEMRMVLTGKRTREQALARIGVWAVGGIRARIAARIDPPNAQSTINKKGSSTPLIDSGQLRSSISNRVVS